MFPLMAPMLIGGGIGLLTNKKNPLEGALMGAALGAGGGLLAPAAAGTAAAGTAAAGTGTAVAGLGTGTAAAAAPPVASAAAAPAWYDGMLSGVKSVANTAKPFSDAAVPAMQIAQMTKEEPLPPIQASPLMAPGQGLNPQMQGLLQSIQSTDAQRAQEEMQKRQTNRAMRGY